MKFLKLSLKMLENSLFYTPLLMISLGKKA